MSTYAEQPFTEFEERYFLAEILKKSALSPTTLLSIIRDTHIEPAWNDIALPNGRSVSACQQAYHSLYNRIQHPQPLQLGPPELPRGHKRPYSSMGDSNTSMPQLQPRPPSFASVNGQGIPIGPGGAPPPLVMSPVEPQRKKRGRPTKAEYERRQAEAQERGEIWPKPRKAKPKSAVDSPEGKKETAGSSSGAQSASSPPKPESAGSSGAPNAAMQPWSAGPQLPPSHPTLSPQGTAFPTNLDRRGGEAPVTPGQRSEGLGRERPMEPPLHHLQGPPSQPGQSSAPPHPYGQPHQSRSQGSPMDILPHQGYPQRDAQAEHRPQH